LGRGKPDGDDGSQQVRRSHSGEDEDRMRKSDAMLGGTRKAKGIRMEDDFQP
jgi:hypothetical protein